jgi:predicted transcriptional regulator
MSDPRQLGDLQLAILRVLWRQGEATAADVHEALLPERGLAPTTIATMLSKLEKRELVTHRTEGRQYIYRATVAQEEARRSMVSEFVDRAFLGDPAALLNHLLTECDLGAEELARLRRMIADHKRGAGDRQ